jgi:hypothetical protein
LTSEEKLLTELQKSMRSNFRRPLLNGQTLAALALGFALHSALMHLSIPFFRHEACSQNLAVNDSRLQQQVPMCDDTLLFPRRAEVSHEIVQTIERHHLGPCGDARLPAQNRKGYADYVSRDPGFLLPEQFPPYRGTMLQHILTGRIPKTTIGRDLKVMPSD